MIKIFKKIISKILALFIRKERFSDPRINKNCTEFEVENWVISDFVIHKLIPVVGFRPFPLSELCLMTAAVTGFKPTHIFERGTNVGRSARIFYETCKTFQLPCEIHSIDLPDDIEHQEHPHRERGRLVRGISGVRLHQGDGIEVSMRIYKNSSKCRPLFFLDGDHSFDTVKRELNMIMTNIPDALILIHDTFYQSPESGYNIGPFLAIQEALKSNPGRYKTIHTQHGLPGMTLLYF